MALAGLLTGYLASDFDPRWTLFTFGLSVILLALGSALLFSRETIHWARVESAAHRAGTHEGPRPRFPANVSKHPSSLEIFKLVSFRHRTFVALSQAGCVEKFVDALVWGFFPVYLYAKGLSLIDIGWVVGVYGFVWGGSQLWSGPLSDAMGRKWPIVIGMWTCAVGVRATLFAGGLVGWSVTAAAMFLSGAWVAFAMEETLSRINPVPNPDQGTQNAE